MRRNATLVLLRLELAEVWRARWMPFVLGAYVVLFLAFGWLCLHESTIVSFTGTSRVAMNVGNAVALAVPLLALVATCQSVVRARSSGWFELFLTQPVRRSHWLLAVVLARLLALVGPLLALTALAALVAGGLGVVEAGAYETVLRSVTLIAALTAGFIGLGMWLSATARTAERATVFALVLWLVSTMLHDFALIGVLLRLRLAAPVVFLLAAMNPTEAVRVAMLSTGDPELSVLGPVGFWLAHTLGAPRLFAVGLLWPLTLGVLGFWNAQRLLRRSDLVG